MGECLGRRLGKCQSERETLIELRLSSEASELSVVLLRNLTVHLGFTKRSPAATAVPSQNRLQRIACRFPSSLLVTRAPAAVSHLPTSVQFPSPPRSIARSDWHTARFALRGDQSLADGWKETYADDVKVPFCTHLPGGANRQPRRLLSRLRRPLLLLRNPKPSAPATKNGGGGVGKCAPARETGGLAAAAAGEPARP